MDLPKFLKNLKENVDEEFVNEWKKIFDTQGATAALNSLRNKNDSWITVPVNVGIIGRSGSGKSSFVNSIRDLKATDEGAAKPASRQQPRNPHHTCIPTIRICFCGTCQG